MLKYLEYLFTYLPKILKIPRICIIFTQPIIGKPFGPGGYLTFVADRFLVKKKIMSASVVNTVAISLFGSSRSTQLFVR